MSAKIIVSNAMTYQQAGQQFTADIALYGTLSMANGRVDGLKLNVAISSRLEPELVAMAVREGGTRGECLAVLIAASLSEIR